MYYSNVRFNQAYYWTKTIEAVRNHTVYDGIGNPVFYIYVVHVTNLKFQVYIAYSLCYVFIK